MNVIPRFGAQLNIRYADNLSESGLDQGKTFVQARKDLLPRVAAIRDEKDPINVSVFVNEDSFSASYNTDRNGSASFEPQPGQTPAEFLASVISAVETKATKLLSYEELAVKAREQQLNDIQHIDAFIDTLANAITNKTAHIYLESHSKDWSKALIQVGGEIYTLGTRPRNAQGEYSISLSHLPSEEEYQKGPANGQKTVFQFRYKPSVGFEGMSFWYPLKSDDGTLIERYTDERYLPERFQRFPEDKIAFDRLAGKMNQLVGSLTTAGLYNRFDPKMDARSTQFHHEFGADGTVYQYMNFLKREGVPPTL